MFSEEYQVIPVIESDDYGSAGKDSDSLNMGKLHHVALAFTFGALTGNSVLKFYSGATAGTKTTALAFSYRLSAGDFAATDADVYGSLTAVEATGLTLTAASFDHRVIIVEFDGSDLSADAPWLTAEIDATATAMNVACVGIGAPRYRSQTMESALD